MNWQAWATAAIIIVAMVLFASEKVRVDVVALITLALLAALGIVSPEQALSGFSNEATVTVAAMFALSIGIERSGALEPVIGLLTKIRKPWLLSLGIMLVIAPLGAFIKNVALVATFLPLALRVCQRTGTSPARVLMPMAFAAQMGGVCTLIGTSRTCKVPLPHPDLGSSHCQLQPLFGFVLLGDVPYDGEDTVELALLIAHRAVGGLKAAGAAVVRCRLTRDGDIHVGNAAAHDLLKHGFQRRCQLGHYLSEVLALMLLDALAIDVGQHLIDFAVAKFAVKDADAQRGVIHQLCQDGVI